MNDLSAIERPSRPRAPRIPDGLRIYAIGDIHGRLDLFEQLIAMIREDAHSRPAAMVRIVVLGDLVDRGPDSAALVERCRALVGRTDRFVVLKGNHEAMMVHAVRGNLAAFALWMRQGGDAALRSWGVSDESLGEELPPRLLAAARAAIPGPTIAWLDGLPLTLESGDYLFVHAGIRPGIALDSQSPDDLLWIRGEFLDHGDDHARIVVHGHSIDDAGAVVRSNRIGIDTGAYRTGVLTALALEGGERWMLATSDIAVEPAPSRSLEQNVAEILRVAPPRSRDARSAPRRGPARAARAGMIAAAVATAGFAWLVIAPPVRRPAATVEARVRLADADHAGRASRAAPRIAHVADRRADGMPLPPAAPQRDASARRLTRLAATQPSDAKPHVRAAMTNRPAGADGPRAPAPVAPAEYVSVAPVMPVARPERADARMSPDFSSGGDDVHIPTEPMPARPATVEVSKSPADPATPKQRLSKKLESIDAIRLLRRQ